MRNACLSTGGWLPERFFTPRRCQDRHSCDWEVALEWIHAHNSSSHAWEKTMRTGGRRIYVTVGTLGGGGKITLIAESTATR